MEYQKEKGIIEKLTDLDPKLFEISESGFFSRAYIYKDGEIVFKFKKRPDTSYQNETKILKFLDHHNLGIKLQSVKWESKDDEYLGLHGITGQILKNFPITDDNIDTISAQLTNFLSELHQISFKNAKITHLDAEISMWQERFSRSLTILVNYFKQDDIKLMQDCFTNKMPQALRTLGEKSVFSHGDLWESNILINQNQEIGIIDFSEGGYYDEAADFMYLQDENLCQKMLNLYNADQTLRQKVAIRRLIKPMFILSAYANSPHQYQSIRPYLTEISKTIAGKFQ